MILVLKIQPAAEQIGQPGPLEHGGRREGRVNSRQRLDDVGIRDGWHANSLLGGRQHRERPSRTRAANRQAELDRPAPSLSLSDWRFNWQSVGESQSPAASGSDDQTRRPPPRFARLRRAEIILGGFVDVFDLQLQQHAAELAVVPHLGQDVTHVAIAEMAVHRTEIGLD